MTHEEWRPVVSFEGLYEVSSLGRVRGTRRRGSHGKPLTGCPVGAPAYLAVWLSKNGEAAPHRIHALVAAAFLGSRPDGHDVAHNNGDRLDNRAVNLRYATRTDNNCDKRKHGRVPVGSKTSSAKLDEKAIPEIRALQGRASSRQVGAMFGVGHAAVLNIWNGRNWTHV